jgi:23S rRNA (cytosine1962-C5)-methyltransferase
MPPCVVFEDEHLLVVNKPAGMNTHAPAPFAGEGIHEWLRDREERWASLVIIHRLDKETSGLLVLSKSKQANRSLGDQFARHIVRKRYRCWSRHAPKADEFTVESCLARAGARYIRRPLHAGGERAVTRFKVVERRANLTVFDAEPITGKTHQIRVHAASEGMPILGDALYGGEAHPRVCLHAESIELKHPATGKPVRFEAPVDFEADPRWALRRALICPETTDVYRLRHGSADAMPDWYVDHLGDWLLAQSDSPLTPARAARLESLRVQAGVRGTYHKTLQRRVRQASRDEASPRHVGGEPAPARFQVSENGLRFELGFQEGYSVGLFLDQRDNRRRFLINQAAAGFRLCAKGMAGAEVLNTFAYTCGFSVAAARAGARVTSVDLSRKYLDWGRRNFELNGLAAQEHEFIFGDVFEWFKRLEKKGRRFDVIVLDPPTFSQSRESGVFRAEKDFARLIGTALPVLGPGGVLLACTNSENVWPGGFVDMVDASISKARRSCLQRHYAPQPPDFPITRDEPGHLKSIWCRVS